MVGNDSSFRKCSSTDHALKKTFIPWILERLLLLVTFNCFTFAVLSFTTSLVCSFTAFASIKFLFLYLFLIKLFVVHLFDMPVQFPHRFESFITCLTFDLLFLGELTGATIFISQCNIFHHICHLLTHITPQYRESIGKVNQRFVTIYVYPSLIYELDKLVQPLMANI